LDIDGVAKSRDLEASPMFDDGAVVRPLEFIVWLRFGWLLWQIFQPYVEQFKRWNMGYYRKIWALASSPFGLWID